MTETNGSAPAGVRPHRLESDYLSRFVQRTFRRTVRGYSPDEVDQHLERVRGWFTDAGFDQLLADRHEEILGSAVREAEATAERTSREAELTIQQARDEAEATLERARRQADDTIRQARHEAEETIQQARATAESIVNDATRRSEAVTAAADARLGSLKTLALSILEETEAQS